ncbi:MAG: MFS transporter [Chloroflexota bacterium]
MPRSHRASAVLFCTATFFFWASLYLYVPVLPVHARSMGGSLVAAGVVVSSYAVPQALVRVPLGLWFDRLARKKTLIIGGVLAAGIGALGLALSPDALWLSVARAVTGVGAATWVAFTVYFASYYAPERAPHAIGTINAVNAGALLVATACGGVLADRLGHTAAFMGAAGLAIAGLVCVVLGREVQVGRQPQQRREGLARVAGRRSLVVASLLGLLLQFVNHAGIFGFVPIYAESIGASATDLGLITMLALASSAVASLFAPRLVDREGLRKTVVCGAALLAVALASVPLVSSLEVLGLVQMVNGSGRGVLMATTMALSLRDVEHGRRATAMGLYQATYAIGMFSGPLASGFLAESLGLTALFRGLASIGALIAVLGVILLPHRR